MDAGGAIYWTIRPWPTRFLGLRPVGDRPLAPARRGRLHAGPRRLGPGLRPGGHARGHRLRRRQRPAAADGPHPPGQPALRQPAEKLGFTEEGLLRGHVLRDGERRDCRLFGLLL